ncbi:TPA: hypothetical protein L9968_005090 [Klebsiella aerogenes]|nr:MULTISPECIES: hypothetical protein [Morganellaceae]EAW3267838.1 hypothetical protein [Salmonella enterica]EIW8783527.1 hypothetical protein [Klebsiella pneumoniae]HBS0237572.1 hypothetical protein [Klebsiella aerogenes]APG53522.1 hypothetical protein BGK56_21535 [Providencia stuartii]EIW8783983.1 hypothetical protein [Klebsiella pneumoniae]
MEIIKVFQHGVELGTLPSDDYQKIRNEVSQDKRASLMQYVVYIIAFIRYLFSIAKTAIIFTAGLIFYLFLFEYQGLTNDLLTLESSRISTYIYNFFLFFVLISVAVYSLPFIVSPTKFFKSLGYYNVKEEKISERLRLLFESPVAGSVYVKKVNEQ